MKVLCAVVGNRVASLEGGRRLPRLLDVHVASCLRCQAICVRDRRMRRDLARLGSVTTTAPPGLAASVDSLLVPRPLAAVTTRWISEDAGASRRRLRSAGTLAGVAAVAAGASAVAAWRIARRPA